MAICIPLAEGEEATRAARINLMPNGERCHAMIFPLRPTIAARISELHVESSSANYGYVVSHSCEAPSFAMHRALSGLRGRSPLRRRIWIGTPEPFDHDLDIALPCDCGGVFEAIFPEDGGSSSWALTSRKW